MPTVPSYPEEDWMLRLGRESGSRQRWQMAMMEPKRAIPESGMAEQEKVITGAAAGAGKAPTQFEKAIGKPPAKTPTFDFTKPGYVGGQEPAPSPGKPLSTYDQKQLTDKLQTWHNKHSKLTDKYGDTYDEWKDMPVSPQAHKELKELRDFYGKGHIDRTLDKIHAQSLQSGGQKPFTAEEMKAGQWIADNVKPAHQDMASKAVKNIYAIADEYTKKWAQASTPSEYHKLEPVDWQTLQNKYVPRALASSPEAAERAAAQGYNLGYPMYRGSASGTTEAELFQRRTMHDPASKEYERGLFFAEKPGVARHYSHYGAQPIEYVASPKNPAIIDMKGKGYNSDVMHDIIETARGKGHDAVVMKDIWDVGGKQNQIIITDPGIIRSPKAQFDPKSFRINDVLATLLGVAGVSKAAKELMGDKDKQ